MIGAGTGVSLDGAAPRWVPKDLGSGLKLWVRPEDLVNPNRLLQTADLEDAAWTTTTTTVLGGQTDPDVGSTAFLLTPSDTNSKIKQTAVGFQAGGNDTGSWWIKRGPGHNGTSQYLLRMADGGGNVTEGGIPPETWTRVDVTRILSGGATKIDFQLFPDITLGTQAVLFWHPQLESGVAASPYRPNGAAAGGILSLWPDQSGNGNDATQGTQASMPLVQAGVLDGYSGALFDKVDDFLALPDPIHNVASDWHIFFVVDMTVADNDFFLATQAGPLYIGVKDSAKYTYYSGDWNVSDSLAAQGPQLVEWALNVAAPKVYVDGVEEAMASATYAQQEIAGLTNLGSSTAGTGNFFGGHMIEIVAHVGVLADRTNILAYLASKYPTLGI